MKNAPRLLSAIAAGLIAAGTLAAPPASAQSCLSQGEARQAVQNGQALPFSQIRGALGGGNIVDAQLCRSGGGLVYVVSILSDDGSVRRVTVSAQTGQVLG